VRNGLEEYGDDFALVPAAYDHSQDDLAWVEHEPDEALSASYAAAEADAAEADAADAASPDATVAEGAVPGSSTAGDADRDRS
jgi:hypothetical protein